MLSSNESMPCALQSYIWPITTHQVTSSIQSVTFVETHPPGIEFNYYGYQNGLCQQAMSEYRSAQISSTCPLV
jgi:hypothetical protein